MKRQKKYSQYIPINNSLNINGLNALIKDTEWQRGLKKIRTYNILPTGDSLQGKRHIQTKSEGMEKYVSCKWR